MVAQTRRSYGGSMGELSGDTTAEKTGVFQVMSRVLNCSVKDRFDEVRAVEKQLGLSTLNRFFALGYDRDDFDWVISPRTLARRKAESKLLTIEESERLLRAVRVHATATAVFEDEGKARSWLSKPKKRLNGKTPLDLIRTEQGAGAVLEWLDSLEYGFYA